MQSEKWYWSKYALSVAAPIRARFGTQNAILSLVFGEANLVTPLLRPVSSVMLSMLKAKQKTKGTDEEGKEW